jgi:hypothetical protein
MTTCLSHSHSHSLTILQLRGGTNFPGRGWLEGVFDSVGPRLNVTSCEDLAQAVSEWARGAVGYASADSDEDVVGLSGELRKFIIMLREAFV